MTDAPELKPCPFCGGYPEWGAPLPSGKVYLFCDNYDCRMATTDALRTREEAITAWNTRADLAKPRVKPLVWDNPKLHDVQCKFETMSSCGLYKIIEWLDNSGHVLFFGQLGEPVVIKTPAGPIGAGRLKAAANAHNESRVLACLEWYGDD